MEHINEKILEKSFLDYYDKIVKRKKYKMDTVPYNLIKTYFLYMNHMPFEKVADNYRKKYILNENKLESVHKQSERAGLRVVYDYILSDAWQKMKNIYVLLEIHSKLYSKVANPEFGGKFRNANAYISNSDIKTCDYTMISKQIAELYNVYDQLLKDAEELNMNKNEKLLFSYIERSIKLKCKLVEIHPFADGNGRSCRALLNILFRSIGLPPIYIKFSEKDEYIEAMDKAIRNKDFTLINQFYYYKICDSIYDLDILERKINGITLRELSRKTNEKNSTISKLNISFKNNLKVNNIDAAIDILHASNEVNNLISKLFNGRITREDLDKVNSSLLLTLIELYADENNENILENGLKKKDFNQNSSLDLFLEEIKDYALLSRDNENKLIKNYKATYNKSIRNLLVNSFQKIIYMTCKKHCDNEHDILNYIQEANMVLIDSIDKYDINSTYRLATFALFNIRNKLDKLDINKCNDIADDISKGEVIIFGANETPEEKIIREVTTQNAYALLQNILSQDELKVALKMFGFDNGGISETTTSIATSLNKDEQEILKLETKVLQKLKSDRTKKMAKNLGK